MTTLWDPVRQKHVAATPEERVRQKWLKAMIDSLGYPKGLLSVEKSIKSIASINSSRRVDILCFTPATDGLKPLLIVECKAQDEGVTPETQVMGYNFSVEAPFLAVVHGNEAKTFWQSGDRVRSVSFIPKYNDLLNAL